MDSINPLATCDVSICLSQMVKGEEHRLILYKGTLIESKSSQTIGP
jgi:hypothetical protein